MSIRRATRKDKFTVISNSVFSSKLSYRAIGLLTYLLSKPDNWEVSVAHLVNHVKESENPTGRDAVYSTLKELVSKGFVIRANKRDQSGKMTGIEYVVFDEPQVDESNTDAPHTDMPDTDLPVTAETTQINTDNKTNTECEINTENTCAKSEKQQLQNDFELFWTKYPRKVNKKKAFDVFKKIDFKKHPLKNILDSIEKWKGSGLWDDTQYIPHPTTWLNGERWTDEIQARPVVNQNNGRAGYIKQDYQNVDWHAGVDDDGRF